MADALSENLINYLIGGQIVANLVTVETNTSSEFELDDGIQSLNKENQYELVQPVDVTVIINEAGIHQPLKPTGEMLNELNSGKNKSRNRNEHIKESNIVVSTPVYDQFVSESRMKTKKTAKVKSKEMKDLKGVGRGDGGVVPTTGAAPGGGSRG